MPIPVSEATRRVAEHASSVARLEVELAALELKKKVVALASHRPRHRGRSSAELGL